jgi:hypothetical protein
MKAYLATYDGAEWVTLIHGETREKAKYRFMRCEPSGWADKSMWVDIRLTRLPEWDNRPFVDCSDIRMIFLPSDYDENGDGIFDESFINDCDCELCKAVR